MCDGECRKGTVVSQWPESDNETVTGQTHNFYSKKWHVQKRLEMGTG